MITRKPFAGQLLETGFHNLSTSDFWGRQFYAVGAALASHEVPAVPPRYHSPNAARYCQTFSGGQNLPPPPPLRTTA